MQCCGYSLKQKKIRIAPLWRERLQGLGLPSVLRCDFLKGLMTASGELLPLSLSRGGAGSEPDRGMTWLEKQVQDQCGLAKIPAGTSLGVS